MITETTRVDGDWVIEGVRNDTVHAELLPRGGGKLDSSHIAFNDKIVHHLQYLLDKRHLIMWGDVDYTVELAGVEWRYVKEKGYRPIYTYKIALDDDKVITPS